MPELLEFPRMIFKTWILLIAGSTAAVASKFTVTVENLRGGNGKVRVLLFAQSDGFPDQPGPAAARAEATAVKGSLEIKFHHLKTGRYAIAVLHDEDSDGKLATNFIGIPKEGVGVSGPLGNSKPAFDQCLVQVKQGGNQRIRIKYW